MNQAPQTTVKIDKNSLGLGGAPDSFSSTSVEAILGTVYLIAGMVAVIAIIIGAIRFMAANGESGKVASAKNVISYAVVGLVVVLVAAAATNWVIGSVSK